MKEKIKSLGTFCKRESVFIISLLLAAVSSCFIPPAVQYFSYIDYRVLAILFCLMVIVAGFKELGVFLYLGQRLSGSAKDSRMLMLLLVFLCFFSSMVITNDVALITFVPFAIELLVLTGMENKIIKVVVLQTVAANLGSMLTPIGNPQNLYLYTLTGMSLTEFLALMLPLTAVSFLLLFIFVWREKPVEIKFEQECFENGFKKKGLIHFVCLFVICTGSVIHLVPWQVSLIVVCADVLVCFRVLLRKVDYCLLGTFAGFFIFVGNIQRIPAVKEMLVKLMEGSELLLSVAASQIISNVPASMLLSGFTKEYELLLYGVNIGGLGTLIASLASLISFKFYAGLKGAEKGKYIAVFTGVNLIFLSVLLLFAGIRF